MNSLVADYGTSSSQSESDNSDVEENAAEENIQDIAEMLKLPKPDFDGSSSKNSVFSNPFVEAENAKKAILEKHVKMVQVPTKDKVQMINGKKICWNYRKGRCRFGHNCTFAHDSDLQKSKEDLEIENQVQSTLLCESTANQVAKGQTNGSSLNTEESQTPDVEDNWEDRKSLKKKRPGLSSGIVPGKKVMKLYKKQKLKP